MRIVVTGAAGFIGRHLVTQLRADGCDVLEIDRSYSKSGADGAYYDLGRDDVGSLTLFLDDVDVVYHLAAVADVRECNVDPGLAWESNVGGTLQLIEAAREAQVGKIVFTSSMAVWENAYGKSESDGPTLPVSWYGATKLAAEAALTGYAREEDCVTDVLICRLGNVVGSGMTRYLLHDTLAKIRANPERIEMLGDGSNVRSFLHVDDAIRALTTLPAREPELYNVAGLIPIAIADAVADICDAVDVDPEIVWQKQQEGWHGDQREGGPSISKAEWAGWTPDLDSTQAIRAAAVEAFRTE